MLRKAGTLVQFSRSVLFASIGTLPSWAGADVELCHNEEPLENRSVMSMHADSIESLSPTLHILHGDAEIRFLNNTLRAEDLSLDVKSSTASTDGPFYYATERRVLAGTGAEIDLKQNIAKITQASYTTCRKRPYFWALEGQNIFLNQKQNHASARHIKLRLLDVPIAYLPYLSFPLGKRKSGFLTPEVANSSKTGIDISLPYYWNIAPNYDATVTPRFLSERGLMLVEELRYLSRNAEGKLQLEFMTFDSQTLGQRGHLRYLHNNRFGKRAMWTTQLQHVSDESFFSDYGDSLAGVSRTALRRYTHFEAFGPYGWASIFFDDYQTLQGIASPYRRLPSTTFVLEDFKGIFHGFISGSAQLLQHDDMNTAQLAQISPGVKIHLTRPSGGAQFTARWDTLAGHQNNQAVTLVNTPSISMDLEAYFDRFTRLTLATITPRLFYVWRPYTDQTALPLINVSTSESSPESLFAVNTLVGSERLSDENRLSSALEYRLSSLRSGREILLLRLAQSLYLSEQRQGLAGYTPKKQGDTLSSAEIQWQPSGRFQVYGVGTYNPQKAQAESALFRVKYSAGAEQIGLSFIDYADRAQLLSASLIQQLGPRWRVLGKSSYLTRAKTFQELLAGIEFQSCCWRIQLTGKAYRSTPDSELDYQAGLLFELRGLSNFGKDKFNDIKNSSF